MRSLIRWLPVAALLAALTGATPGLANPISIARDGSAANGPSAEPRSTPDGLYIVYYSAATNLTPMETASGINVFVYDQTLGINSIISLSAQAGGGLTGDAPSIRPDISNDGRYVVFESEATNLLDGDSEGYSDIFVHDRQTGLLKRITEGVEGDSKRARISGDGRVVVFQSDGRITADDTNAVTDIYRYDLASGATSLVSLGRLGAPADGPSTAPAINDDGTKITYQSDATNIVTGDLNHASDVFVFDGRRNTTFLVSSTDQTISPDSVHQDDPQTGDRGSFQPAISGDGRWVAFASDASNLVAGDRNRVRDIFVFDTASGSTQLITRSFFGEPANGNSERPDISEHGRFVGFESDATNLTPLDDNGIRDAFMIELANGQVARLSGPASREMESPSGFGTVSVAATGGSDPAIFGELPGGFGDTGPGDQDDGTIIPGACGKPPFCSATDINNMPVDLIEAQPGQEVRYTVTARSLCLARILTLDLREGTSLPTGATQTPSLPKTGLVNGRVPSDFSWTPAVTDIGEHIVRYMVIDNVERLGLCEIIIRVGSCDAPPVCDIDYGGSLTVEVGQPVTFTLTAQAFCDNQPVLVEAVQFPAGAGTTPTLPAMSNGGDPLMITVDWTPMAGDANQQIPFLFRTTDVFDQTTECGLTFSVVPPPCDFNPECSISGPTMINAAPGDLITFDVTGTTLCTDFVGLTLDTTALPAGATLTPMTPVSSLPGAGVMTSFAWTPTADDMGTHEATFSITDDIGRTTTCGVTIDVGACPNTPVCDTPDGDNFVVFMNEMLTFTVRGTSDCPNAVLTLDSDSLPAGAVILEGLPLVGAPGQPVVGTFQWAPGIDGQFDVGFSVTDQTGQASMCSVGISVVDCDSLPVLTVDPNEPFLVAPGDFVTFSAVGTTECPKTGLAMKFNNVPDGAIVIPDPTLTSGPNMDVGGIFEWTPTDSDIGLDFFVDITLTDTFGRMVSDQIEISVAMVCLETEVNDTPEEANIIDADCVYFSGKLQTNPVITCEADTYLTLFDKTGKIINRDDNGSTVGNGWASGLVDVGIRNDSAPRPFGDRGDGLINNGDGSFSLRMGITGRPDGLDGVFNGLFLNTGHGQLGAFRVTVTFKNINGNVITPIGYPASAPMENPVVYEDEFVTGAEAFRINYTAPLGTSLVDIEIDNLIVNDTVSDDVDFFIIRGLIPLCDYCITQVGGIDCDCRPTDLNLGWFDKLGNIIITDDNSGPVEGYADLCVVADANGRALIGVTGTGDDNFNGLADIWEGAAARAPVECGDPPHAHGICGCYTLCIMASGPHAGTAQATTAQLDARLNGDLNGDGRVDTADLSLLMGMMSTR